MNKKPNRRKTRFYKSKKLWGFLAFCTLLGMIALVIFDRAYLNEFRERALNDYDYSKVDDVEIPSEIYDHKGLLIGRSYEENRSLVTIAEIPPLFINALLAQEDQRFWAHNGVDWKGVLRAVYLNLKAGETTQGASTITMQLARNAFDLKTEAEERGESGIERKIAESFVALQIEKEYVGDVTGEERIIRKRKLLEMYLNRVHFGKGYYGIRAASLGFFGKEPQDLSISECASMVACIKNPLVINPIGNPERNRRDRNHVFTRMLAEGQIATQEEYEQLCAAPVKTNPRPLRRGTSHLYDKVVSLTRNIVGDDAMSRGGFLIYTTIDKEVQEAAHQKLREQLLKIERHEGYRHPLLSGYDRESTDSPEYLQGAVLVTDTETGAVIAHVGGREFRHSQYDFIESGRRPMGTAFLPVVYATAFENKKSPATLTGDYPLDNREVMLGGMEGILGEWGSEIQDPIYEMRDITSRQALRESKIAATVRLGVDVGISTVAAQAKKFGLPMDSGEILSRLLLGWEQNSLWQASRIYSSFANGGRAPEEPYYIESIKDISGKLIYRAPRSKGKTLDLCSSATSYQLHSILSDTTKSGNLTEWADQLAEPDLSVVKTGSNYNFSDAWSLGYNGNVTCGVWVGFWDGRKAIHDLAFGKDLALPVWAEVMNVASRNFPGKEVKMPPTLTSVNLCESSGKKVTRYCYESVFDLEEGINLVSTAYPEFLRVGETEIGICPVHGEGGVASSVAFAPDTQELRQRNLSIEPIPVKAQGLVGDDPYSSQVNKAPTDEEAAAATEEALGRQNGTKQEFVLRESQIGEKEAKIDLRSPPRMIISDE